MRAFLSIVSIAVAVAAGGAGGGCSCARPSDGSVRSHGARPAETFKLAEVIFDGGFGKGWQDDGWAPREFSPNTAARFNLSDYGGWIIEHPGLNGSFGGLVFRFRAPREYGDFLEVRVDSTQKSVYPRIMVSPSFRTDLPDEWSEVMIPMRLLNPEKLPFDRIVIRAARPVGRAWIGFDKLGLTGADAAVEPVAAPLPTKDVVLTVDCRAPAPPINPAIYGIAFDALHDGKDSQQWELGATGRRWGGNTTSRYNWELGNAWNTGLDWFYENVNSTGDPTFSYKKFFAANEGKKVQTALTVPMIGWVAKDITSFSFPVSVFGPQHATDSWRPDAGDGRRPDGKPIAPGTPTRTSVAAPPEMVKRWVEAIRAEDAKRGARTVQTYILDNEPALWNDTHRDVHPEPVTYDELLHRTIAYGSAVRAADPAAVIAGPAEWGWPAYNFSAKDSAEGLSFRPDRRAHGDVPLLAWYLRKLREHEAKTGTRILDVLDVHFYPQAKGVFGQDGGIDSKTAALRIRSTRALWDPTYVDESWIGEAIRLFPRLKDWIQQNYPGRGISIGEWNFGAEKHMSGGLAVAEVLGRFGQAGIASAYYWTYPPKNSPVFWAFRAFRNFDGSGGRFLDLSMPTVAAEGTSLFASRDASGKHLVLVALNFSADHAVRPQFVLAGCNRVSTQRAYEFSGDPSGYSPRKEAPKDGAISIDAIAPYSITVLDLVLEASP